jgi:hypothetical protein
MRFSPGSTAQLTASVTSSSGASVTPDEIVADIFDSSGTKVLSAGVPTLLMSGLYGVSYDIPEDAQVGLWRIEWTVTEDGLETFGDEFFEVELPDSVVVTPGEVIQSQLRARLGESKVDPDGDGSETFFDDDAVFELLTYADGDLDRATAEGWIRKMAKYARLVDVTESGADRKMSQKFKNAKEMVAFWNKIVSGAVIERQNALAGRVVGRAVNLRCDSSEPVLTPFSGYSDHVREYPTHRLLIPAILS